jgi:type IV pilus assembly protein PilC
MSWSRKVMAKRFAYKALDNRGKPLEGYMEADSAEDVGIWLADRNYFVLDIALSPLRSLVSKPGTKLKINSKQMNFFLLQLSSLINAGCPLIMSLHALYRQLPACSLKTLLKDLSEKIESGKSFSEALKGHKEVFSNLFITMVEVGEVGGILGEVLQRYASIHDAMYRIKAKIAKSMIYPAILLTCTIAVAWALLVYVFPVFVDKIKSHGQALPVPTEIVLFASNFLTSNSVLLVSIFIAILLAFLGIRATKKGKRVIASYLINIPIFGPLLQQLELSLFARILGTLLKCGVPILTSLHAVEKALGNQIYKEALKKIREGVSRGESLSHALIKKRHLFPESIILMTDVGERSGNTGEMLEKAGVIYERDLEGTLETIVSLIQPFLVIFLGIFVVILALAMYMPLFDIIKTVK